MQTKTIRSTPGLPLTGNMLKIIAAVTMTIDHIGVILLPGQFWLRLIGRIAMPIFAYMIAEGCRYTKSMLRYFLGVFLLGVLCQLVYLIAGGDMYLCMPISYSISILLIWTLKKGARGSRLWYALFALGIAVLYAFTRVVHIDYGFWGCLMPVAAAIPMLFKKPNRYLSIGAMSIVMIAVSLYLGNAQWWSFMAVPLLLLYNGKRGKYPMKYFFYIFYPGHLAILQALQWLMAAL